MASSGPVRSRWPRAFVAALDAVNRKGKSAGVRLTKYTGKSPHFVHPKHLIEDPSHDWYLPDLGPGDQVLDVGCANGAHTLRAALGARSVVGFDRDARQLSIAGETARRLGRDNVAFFAGDVTAAFPFRDRAFDAVLFLDVIEHLHPRVAVLREIARVLKPDGRLFVSGPNRETTWRRRLHQAGLFAFSDPDHKVEYSRDEFLGELAAGGFRPVGELLPVVYDTPWAGFIDAVGGLSLRLYARLARWKREQAIRRPHESTGFRAIAVKVPAA